MRLELRDDRPILDGQEAKRLRMVDVENAKLRQSIRTLIEVYAPHERKAILLREHLSE